MVYSRGGWNICRQYMQAIFYSENLRETIP